jgi:DNA-binding NarL/FixJ family response regulator
MLRYVNATQVLPPDLLEAVVEAVGGRSMCVWVPGRRSINRGKRDQYIASLHASGHTAADIAERVLISERTVWRILARERARRAPSDPAGGRTRQ